MSPRRDRWLSLLEVANLLARELPRLAELSRKSRRRHVLRIVQRCERRDGERLSKKIGREWFVSRNAVDALQKWEPEALTELQREVAHLHQKAREQQRQMNGYGSKLREHGSKIGVLEEKQRANEDYFRTIGRIERAANASRLRQA
ncbi:MAG TPA: hypothetical protein VGK73_15100 [Polyangiaceae bacterium]